MDPNACLYSLINAITEGDADEVETTASDLAQWLADDGFIPDRLVLIDLFNTLAADVPSANTPS